MAHAPARWLCLIVSAMLLWLAGATPAVAQTPAAGDTPAPGKGRLQIEATQSPVSGTKIPPVDSQQLERGGSDPKALPADTIFSNRPSSVWEEHREYVVAGGLVLLLFALLTAILIWQNRRLRLTDAALAASASRYYDLYDTAPVGYCSVSESGSIQQANITAARLLGVAQEDLIGQPFSRLIDTEDAKYFCMVRELLKTESPRACELRMLRPGGARFWAHLEVALARDGSGPSYRIALSDISQRKQVEQSLGRSETRFRQMFEKNASILLLIDPESGVIVDANAAASRFYGYTVDEMRAMRIDQINTLTPAEVAAERKRAARLERNYFIFPHRIASGETRTVEVRSTPIEVDGSTLLFSIIHDVTQSKLAEQALVESENRLSAIFHASPIGIVVRRIADGEILEANDAALQLYGLKRDEAIGRTIDDLGIYASPAQYAEVTRQLAEHGSVDRFAVDFRHSGGRTGVMELSAQIVELRGEPCLVAMLVDITERKRHEAALRRLNEELELRIQERTHDLQIANRELESFSYSVSHDLRAPLRAIEGFSSLLERDYGDKLDEQGRHYFRRVRSGAVRMSRLIDDLLKLSRISRHEMHRAPVDLSALAREVAEELRVAEPERAVEWVIAPGIRTEGDFGLLRVALQNLIGNAWKYSAKRADARIEFGACALNGRPSYFVRDNGVGFDMAYADKLFGAFQRLHSTEEFSGTGIGLATVKRIIHRHGGEIWAESRVDQGATFYFSL